MQQGSRRGLLEEDRFIGQRGIQRDWSLRTEWRDKQRVEKKERKRKRESGAAEKRERDWR